MCLLEFLIFWFSNTFDGLYEKRVCLQAQPVLYAFTKFDGLDSLPSTDKRPHQFPPPMRSSVIPNIPLSTRYRSMRRFYSARPEYSMNQVICHKSSTKSHSTELRTTLVAHYHPLLHPTPPPGPRAPPPPRGVVVPGARGWGEVEQWVRMCNKFSAQFRGMRFRA